MNGKRTSQSNVQAFTPIIPTPPIYEIACRFVIPSVVSRLVESSVFNPQILHLLLETSDSLQHMLCTHRLPDHTPTGGNSVSDVAA